MTKYLLFTLITLLGFSLNSNNDLQGNSTDHLPQTELSINIDSIKNVVNNDIAKTIAKRESLENELKSLKSQIAYLKNQKKDTVLIRVKSFNEFKNSYKK